MLDRQLYDRFIRYAVAVTLFLASVGVAQEIVLTVQGASAPDDGRAATGRSLAIDDALRNAVQQGVGTYVNSETLVENFVLIEDRIVTRAAGFARLIEITQEGFDDSGLYRITAEVAVSGDALRDNLRDIIRSNGDPRIMIAAREETPSQSLIPYTVTTLRRDLLDVGFSLVETGNQLPDFGDIDAVANQALRFGADLALLVDVQASEAPNPPEVLRNAGLTSVSTTLSLNLVDMASSRIIYSDVGTNPGASVTAAAAAQNGLEDTLPPLQTSLSDELVRWLQGAGDADRVYTLTVQGLGGYAQAGELMDALNTNRNTARVELRSFRGDTATLDLDYQGTRDGLLALLGELGWNIVGIQNRDLVLEP